MFIVGHGSTHWSSGIRKNASDLPDIAVPSDAYTTITREVHHRKESPSKI